MTTYTFTTFNDPLGTGSTGIMLFGLPETGTIGLGISATTGTIVGTYIDSNGIPEGFSFDGTTYTTVTNPLAANGTAIWGVNDSGQMVGTLSNSNNNSSSFLDSGGQFTPIAYPSAVITYAMGLNDSGQVVGFYEAGGPTNNFVPAGFLYSNGIYTTINDPLGTTATIADAINNQGQIVGIYADSNNTPHGFLLSGGVYTTIDDPLGVNGTIVKGINDSGEIVGGYLDSNDDLHGFLYANGTYTTFDYPGAAQTMLSGITDSGEILGSYVASNGDHGFTATTGSPSTGGLLGTLSVAQQTELIYIGYFNRSADAGGFNFWEGQDATAQAGGQSASVALTNIANSFTPQPETIAIYPFLSTLSPNFSNPTVQAGLTTFIGNVYENLFDRAADSGGLTYWVGQIESRAVGLGAAVLAIANGATGSDAIMLQNKITVASDFTNLTNAANVPVSSALYAEAKTVLAGVDGVSLNDASVTAAEALIAPWIASQTAALVGSAAPSAHLELA